MEPESEKKIEEARQQYREGKISLEQLNQVMEKVLLAELDKAPAGAKFYTHMRPKK